MYFNGWNHAFSTIPIYLWPGGGQLWVTFFIFRVCFPKSKSKAERPHSKVACNLPTIASPLQRDAWWLCVQRGWRFRCVDVVRFRVKPACRIFFEFLWIFVNQLCDKYFTIELKRMKRRRRMHELWGCMYIKKFALRRRGACYCTINNDPYLGSQGRTP